MKAEIERRERLNLNKLTSIVGGARDRAYLDFVHARETKFASHNDDKVTVSLQGNVHLEELQPNETLYFFIAHNKISEKHF